MTRTPSSTPTGAQGIRPLLLGGLVAAMAVITLAFGHRSQSSSSALAEPASSPSSLALPPRSSSPPTPTPTPPDRRGRHPGAVGEADGVVPDGVTVFDDAIPAVARLEPDLLAALRRAAARAAHDGVTLYVNSGWRSPEYQNQLLRQAVSTYGSEDAAARWVASAATSPHVSGDAVDLGHADATAWLSGNGARYGLCQIYHNEPWHYELRPRAATDGCPRMYANPTQDPRMQR